VDDRPFGGGEGMLLKPEPLFEAVEAIAGPVENRPARTAIVLLSASGKLFRQESARRFAQLEKIVLLCGRYEGVDERVAEHLVTDELSIGDFVLSGGELAAALVVDAVTRLLPGALGNENSSVNESFSEALALNAATQGANQREDRANSQCDNGLGPRGLLDCPHYTRPAEFRGWPVPAVLLGGNHEEIRQWRAQKALEKTWRNRPDLFHSGTLNGYSNASVDESAES
jgi:tRNA (guanine37-N1)-methyltransferase